MNFFKNFFRKETHKVTFVRDEKKPHPEDSHIEVTKKIYMAQNKEDAVSFLLKQNVTQSFYYIEIDTPVGRFGIDRNGKVYDNYGKFIETDKQVIKTNQENLVLFDFKSDHSIIIHSIVIENGGGGCRYTAS